MLSKTLCNKCEEGFEIIFGMCYYIKRPCLKYDTNNPKSCEECNMKHEFY